MDRDQQIEAILDFVHKHPESLASRAIRRGMTAEGEGTQPDGQDLQQSLASLDEETLAGYYYMVR